MVPLSVVTVTVSRRSFEQCWETKYSLKNDSYIFVIASDSECQPQAYDELFLKYLVVMQRNYSNGN